VAQVVTTEKSVLVDTVDLSGNNGIRSRNHHVRLSSASADRDTAMAMAIEEVLTAASPALNKDAPIPRPLAGPNDGRIVAIPQVGGLHHRYERQAA
jgi:hypothetical protein